MNASDFSNSLADSIFEEVVDYIKRKLSPEDIFSESDLEDWATVNGYVHEGDVEDPEYWAVNNGYVKKSELESWARSHGFVKSEELL